MVAKVMYAVHAELHFMQGECGTDSRQPLYVVRTELHFMRGGSDFMLTGSYMKKIPNATPVCFIKTGSYTKKTLNATPVVCSQLGHI